MSYVPQDVGRLLRRGAGDALISEALAHASSEVTQAVRSGGAEPPETLAGFGGDAGQVERYLIDLAVERLRELQTPEILRSEVLSGGEGDHLLFDPDALAAEMRAEDSKRSTWDEWALAVCLEIARLAGMPDGVGSMRAEQTFHVRGERLRLPRFPVAEIQEVKVDGAPVEDWSNGGGGVLNRPNGWGAVVAVVYDAGYAPPRSKAPNAWRLEAVRQLRREWTSYAAGGFTPTQVGPGGFQFTHNAEGESEEDVLKRLGLFSEGSDREARVWLEEVRSGRRILDIRSSQSSAARFVPRRRAGWALRLHGRSS